jgi:hypothetical protein
MLRCGICSLRLCHLDTGARKEGGVFCERADLPLGSGLTHLYDSLEVF